MYSSVAFVCLIVPNIVASNQEGRNADPLNINGGVGTIGTINNREGRSLLPCPFYAGHPLQYQCNYAPYTYTRFPNPFPPGFPFHNVPAPQPLPTFPPGFPFHNVPAPRTADPLNINGGVGTIGTINNQEGRLADPLNINGGVGTIGTINNKEGRLADPLYINGGVGTIGTINNREGRLAQRKECVTCFLPGK